MNELVKIIYYGQEILVTQEIACYFEENRKVLRRQSEKDRHHKANYEILENIISEYVIVNDFADEIIQKLEIQRLRKAIMKLPEIQKRRLAAYFFEGLTYRQIAEREGVDHKAVMRSVHSAIKRLKIVLC